MTTFRCETCHADVPSYEITHFGLIEAGYRDLCSRCYNRTMVELGAPEFDHVSFEPITIADAAGRQRKFHFLLRHLGD